MAERDFMRKGGIAIMTVSMEDCPEYADSWIRCLLLFLSCGEDLDDLLFSMEPYAVSER